MNRIKLFLFYIAVAFISLVKPKEGELLIDDHMKMNVLREKQRRLATLPGQSLEDSE